MPKRFSAAALLAVLLAIGFLGSAASGSSAENVSSGASLGTIRICTNCLKDGVDLSQYQYVVLNAWDSAQIPALKQANPNIKVLVYKDMSSTRSYSCGGEIPTGVDYCWTAANRPDWFTHKNGQRIEWAGYSGHWQMNIGLKAYQDQWAANVISDLESGGWDGTFVDNANMDPNGYAELPYDEYPTQASYQAATRSFLADVGPKVKAADFLIIPNIQHHGILLTASVWKDWTQFCSGGHLEHYSKWNEDSTGQLGGAAWTDEQNFERSTEAAGQIFIGTFYAPTSDNRSMRYARASFLLDWDGGPSALAYIPSPYQDDPWSAGWTQQVGTPVGSRYQVGNAYRRNYTGGTVVVNPSASSQRVDLGGSFLMPNSSAVSAVTLAPMTGLVMRSDSAVTPAPTAPVTVPIKLKISKRLNPRKVELHWSGARSSTVDIYRVTRLAMARAGHSYGATKARPAVVRHIAMANTGSYTAKFGSLARGSYAFRVCEPKTRRCSGSVSIVVRARASS